MHLLPYFSYFCSISFLHQIFLFFFLYSFDNMYLIFLIPENQMSVPEVNAMNLRASYYHDYSMSTSGVSSLYLSDVVFMSVRCCVNCLVSTKSYLDFGFRFDRLLQLQLPLLFR